MCAAPLLHYIICQHPAIFSPPEPPEGQPRIREPVQRAQLEAPGGLFSPLHILQAGNQTRVSSSIGLVLMGDAVGDPSDKADLKDRG